MCGKGDSSLLFQTRFLGRRAVTRGSKISIEVVERLSSTEEKIQYLRRLEAMARGDSGRAEEGRAMGKMTPRERLAQLFDGDTFTEIDLFVVSRDEETDFLGDGVVTGYGLVEGRVVYAYAQDWTIMGGSLGEIHAEKICKVIDLALKAGAPLVCVNDSGGARLREGLDALAGYGSIMRRHAMASGVIPQLSLVVGPCTGGGSFLPALTDFVFMLDENASMFVRAPQVISAVTGKRVTLEEVGSARVHASSTGVAHFLVNTESEGFAGIRRLLGYLPSNNLEEPPALDLGDDLSRVEPELATLVPPDANKPYDMRQVISAFVDNGEFLEIHKAFAANMIVGLGRLGGYVIGIVGNQPRILAGCLDIDASDKAARFVRFCDAFNIPLVTLVDTPGYLPGTDQEHGGIIRHGAKLLYAYSEASVPKLTLVVRNAYGGAYIAMCSRALGADVVLSWPTAEIAVMGPEGAANIIYKNEMAEASDPEAVRQEKIAEYRDRFANPYVAASRGFVDSIIHPAETRPQLFTFLEGIASKREARPPKKHGNFPA